MMFRSMIVRKTGALRAPNWSSECDLWRRTSRDMVAAPRRLALGLLPTVCPISQPITKQSVDRRPVGRCSNGDAISPDTQTPPPQASTAPADLPSTLLLICYVFAHHLPLPPDPPAQTKVRNVLQALSYPSSTPLTGHAEQQQSLRHICLCIWHCVPALRRPVQLKAMEELTFPAHSSLRTHAHLTPALTATTHVRSHFQH